MIRVPSSSVERGSLLYITQRKILMNNQNQNPRRALGNSPGQSRGRPRPGRRNIVGFGFDFHPEVFIASALLIFLFVTVTLIFREPAETAFGAIHSGIAEGMGWIYIMLVSLYLGFVVLLACSKFGKIRLGGQNAQPEFSTFAWIAMLISAGMGIGLMFWSVAEPTYHFQAPPAVIGAIEPLSRDAAQQALGITFFHWGLHARGIYALVG